ncbi:MAG: hypothetical protein C4533_03890 [Candidatus Omnitrophota bacterium]|jgi:processive 1,2-diacylglycerol beta-glucosyltransferase|nr:MAG: hypothetical protein C4533_03890 [Candidatus Omnitrophota bacterium]
MKIIIVYASAGAGHASAATAVFNHFKKEFTSHQITIVDILEYSNSFYKFVYSGGYSILVTHMPLLWGLLFYLTSNKRIARLTNRIQSFINRIFFIRFERFMISEQPDYIITTHFLPPGAVEHLKKKRKIAAKVITVITDFGVHPFWLNDCIDNYIVASEVTSRELAGMGIAENKIDVFGIPAKGEFYDNYDKSSLRAKIGLDNDVFTVLISTGSFGMGPIEDIVFALKGEMQILVVCANNKKLYKRLIAKNYPKVKIFAFINNIYELMAVSDLMITKPGGLTISELIAMRLVPVFISPIPGQETVNARVIVSQNAGFAAKNTEELKKLVILLRDNPARIKEARDNMKDLIKPNPAISLSNVIR